MPSSFPRPQQSLTEEKADLNSTSTDLIRVSQNTDDDHFVQDNMRHLNSRHQEQYKKYYKAGSQSKRGTGPVLISLYKTARSHQFKSTEKQQIEYLCAGRISTNSQMLTYFLSSVTLYLK